MTEKYPELYPEPTQLETVEDVIEQLKNHRQTHAEWAEHLEETGEESDNGDSKFHRYVESKYDKMISILEE